LILDHNLKEAFKHPLEAPHPQVLMVDETSLTPRVRYDSRHNTVVGFCMEHTSSTNIQVKDEYVLKTLYLKLEKKEIHVAMEASVVSLTGMHALDYRAKPLLELPSCKFGNDWSTQVTIFKGILDHFKSVKLEEKVGPVYILATDGDGRRRKAFHHMCSGYDLKAEYPELWEKLGKLKHFDMTCGERGLVFTSDLKHLLKRLRGMCSNGDSLPSIVSKRPLGKAKLMELL
jgi:hypothetical protein